MRPGRIAGRIFWIAAGLLAATTPRVSEAHLASTRFGDFYGGVLHVGTAPEHLLALIALALYAALQERLVARWILLAAPPGLLCGACLAALVPLGAPSPAIAMALLVVTGLLIALGCQVSEKGLLLLGLLVGLLHGYQNGLAVTERTVVHLFAFGVAVSGLIAVALLAAAGALAVEKTPWAAIALRAGGSWIAAIGTMMLGFSIA